jgi:hypothetical protein
VDEQKQVQGGGSGAAGGAAGGGRGASKVQGKGEPNEVLDYPCQHPPPANPVQQPLSIVKRRSIPLLLTR